MLSLKNDQNDTMNNINAILNSKDTREGLIDCVKSEVRKLSLIHLDMQELQAFILQLTEDSKKSSGDSENETDKK